jgi:hypothetical protein
VASGHVADLVERCFFRSDCWRKLISSPVALLSVMMNARLKPINGKLEARRGIRAVY